MAETHYPNPGVTQLQHERLMGGASASGVFGHPSDDPVVYANGTGTREVRIRVSRRAIVEGYGWENDTAEILKTLAVNASGSTRVDLVVLRLDRAAFTVTVQVKTGTPGAGAPSPTYGTGTSGVWELPLAEVTVASGATTLASSTVKNRAWYIGSDGQIRCTETTRPQHEAGRTAFETDTARWILSNGSAWVNTIDDSGWVNMSAASGWAVNHLRIRRVSGIAYLQVDVRRTGPNLAASTTSRLSTAPAGFLPAGGTVFAAATIYHYNLGRVSVDAAGAVVLSNHEGINTAQYLVTSLSWPIG